MDRAIAQNFYAKKKQANGYFCLKERQKVSSGKKFPCTTAEENTFGQTRKCSKGRD